MSALKTTTDTPALRGQPIAHDQARALLGQVMGLVAVITVGFTALGAYLGRDLSGGPALCCSSARPPASSASTSPPPRA